MQSQNEAFDVLLFAFVLGQLLIYKKRMNPFDSFSLSFTTLFLFINQADLRLHGSNLYLLQDSTWLER